MTQGIRPRNYGFFEKFDYFVPGVAELFILLAIFLLSSMYAQALVPAVAHVPVVNPHLSFLLFCVM